MQLNASLTRTDSLLVPSEFSRKSQWFHWALAQLWQVGFISLNVDARIWATAYPSFIVRVGKAACFYGLGRKQLVWGCGASHPNVDVWKRFCEFWPKTTHLSPLTINGARVTSWDGDESSSCWVKKSASAVYTNCSLLELWYNPTSLRLFSSLSACTKCLLVTLQSI